MHDGARANPFEACTLVERAEVLVRDEEDAVVLRELRFLEAREVLFEETRRNAAPAVWRGNADGVDADGGAVRVVRGHR